MHLPLYIVCFQTLEKVEGGGGVKYAKSDRCPSPKNPSPTPCQLPQKTLALLSRGEIYF
jgi:hypothetical protein